MLPLRKTEARRDEQILECQAGVGGERHVRQAGHGVDQFNPGPGRQRIVQALPLLLRDVARDTAEIKPNTQWPEWETDSSREERERAFRSGVVIQAAVRTIGRRRVTTSVCS